MNKKVTQFYEKLTPLQPTIVYLNQFNRRQSEQYYKDMKGQLKGQAMNNRY